MITYYPFVMKLKKLDILNRSQRIFIFFPKETSLSSTKRSMLEPAFFLIYHRLHDLGRGGGGAANWNFQKSFFENFISLFDYVRMCYKNRIWKDEVYESKYKSHFIFAPFIVQGTRSGKVPRLQLHRRQGLAIEFPHCHLLGDLIEAQQCQWLLRGKGRGLKCTPGHLGLFDV